MTNRLPVFYDQRMTATVDSFSPSAAKPAAVVQDWLGVGLPVSVLPFEPVEPSALFAVHGREYVIGVLAGTLPNGFGSYDSAVAAACLRTCGSMLAAARHALTSETGVACSPSSGFHHAHRNRGYGFCTFNGLALAAVTLAGAGARVGILDCDFHYGDGTTDILARTPRRGQERIVHHSAGAEYGRGANSKVFLGSWLPSALDAMRQCDIVLYQAGADPHVDDPLGGFMTDLDLRTRDRLVFSYLAAHGVACAWNLAGGYRRDDDGSIEPVIRTHRMTARACVERLDRFASGRTARRHAALAEEPVPPAGA